MTPKTIALAAISFAILGASGAYAGAMDNACMKAGRASNNGLCSCIQKVADMTLSGGDQRRAAGFFHDPDEAQQVRQSDRPSDEDFWQRYKNFVAAAEGYCG
ncbi:hypothetical protein ERN12_11045 [Rhodobacteraceae bacterium]|nr:hypothetical protein ERN12_11045 [Paracoccaceae bacterium]